MIEQPRLHMFRWLCLSASALYSFLFVSLLLFPDSIIEGMGAKGGEMAYFLARRASMLMLGFALLLFLVRNIARSNVRIYICAAVAVNMAGFAWTGIYEFMKGGIGGSIFLSVTIELLSASLFASMGFYDYRHLRDTIKE